MQLYRPAFAVHPMRFGRGPVRVTDETVELRGSLAADIKLFAATFAVGFVFVSIVIG